jgi:hypothetical protein
VHKCTPLLRGIGRGTVRRSRPAKRILGVWRGRPSGAASAIGRSPARPFTRRWRRTSGEIEHAGAKLGYSSDEKHRPVALHPVGRQRFRTMGLSPMALANTRRRVFGTVDLSFNRSTIGGGKVSLATISHRLLSLATLDVFVGYFFDYLRRSTIDGNHDYEPNHASDCAVHPRWIGKSNAPPLVP